MSRNTFLGLGIGWRPEISLLIDRRLDLGFVEVLAETIDPHFPLPKPIRRLMDRGVKMIPHGVSLSIGSAEGVDPGRVQRLAAVALKLDAPFVSEHLAFVRAGGKETGHLLPLQRNQRNLQIVVENIQRTMEVLDRPLVLENISSVFEWPDNEMSEADFLSEVIRQTGVGLLLDLQNVYANCINFDRNPREFIDSLPLESIAYLHVAGGVERDGILHDTHAHPVHQSVLDLLKYVVSKVHVPGVMLERDDLFPGDEAIGGELDSIADAVRRGDALRSGLGDHQAVLEAST